MPSPKISVIVPVYNAEKWLRRCVDSILAQTYTDFEVLLIDDGSTDGSGVICDEYTALDSRVRTFHKPNGGVSSARNLGLDNARGEWICFVDSDDEIRSFQGLHEIDWNSEMVLFPLRIIHHNMPFICEFPLLDSEIPQTRNNYIKYYLHLHIFSSVCAKLIRRNTIKDLRFDEKIRFGEDSLFNLQLMIDIKKISFCDNVEYIYHQEEDYGVKYIGSLDEAIATMKKIFDVYQKFGQRNRIFEINVFNCYRMICKDEWGKNPSFWNYNKIVESIYKQIKGGYTLSFRIKYRLATTKLYHIHRFIKTING